MTTTIRMKTFSAKGMAAVSITAALLGFSPLISGCASESKKNNKTDSSSLVVVSKNKDGEEICKSVLNNTGNNLSDMMPAISDGYNYSENSKITIMACGVPETVTLSITRGNENLEVGCAAIRKAVDNGYEQALAKLNAEAQVKLAKAQSGAKSFGQNVAETAIGVAAGGAALEVGKAAVKTITKTK